ncbi:MAG: hypothetical protein AAGE94_09240 [Acidobacteriota bacterium]
MILRHLVRHHSRQLVAFVAASLWLCMASTPLVASPAAAAAAFPCSEGGGRSDLVLDWRHLPDETSQVRPTGSAVDLSVSNHSDQVLFVELSAAAVLDDLRETQALGTVIVPAHTSVSVPVDLAGFSLTPQQLDFSGRLSAKGVGRTDQGAPVRVVAYAPSIYYHDVTELRVYREQPMRDDYRAGDFGHRAEKLRAWADARGLRVTGIGYYSDLPLSDDDGGPPDPTPDPQRDPTRDPHRTKSSSDTHHEVTP